MFIRSGPNSATSSEGYSVSRTERCVLQYTEGERLLIVEVELGEQLAVYASSLSCGDRDLIVDRIGKALDFLGVPHVIVP